jgi:hypothetical protein
MKKLLLLGSALTVCSAAMHAQSVIDTVSVGAGYANQTFYNLSTGTKSSVPKNTWDLSFDATAFGSSVQVNSATGTMIWTYPNGDINSWNTVDTAGLSSWTPQYNSDTSWAIGAFDKGADATNPIDLGWGIYSTTTHIITGDSLFVIKLSNGDYKRLWIKNLSSGIYNFVYANLDGTSEQTATVDKANYANKNFGYYSIVSGAALDHEPAQTANWDLLFTQYTAFLPMAYTVTGVLSNKGVQVAKLSGIANVATYNNYQTQTYQTAINTIGYDWKSFTGTAYAIEDSTLYFVKTADTDVWKMVFTGFDGSSTGNTMFSKEKLNTVLAIDEHAHIIASLSIYPNPVAAGANVNVAFDLQKGSSNANLTIVDISGRILFNQTVNVNNGFSAVAIPTQGLKAGLYLVSLSVDGKKATQKVIVQ